MPGDATSTPWRFSARERRRVIHPADRGAAVTGRVLFLPAIPVAALVAFAAASSTPIVPTFAEVRSAHRPSEARLLDRDGELIHEVRMDLTVRRLPWVSLDAISPALTAAVLASEDRRFLSHRGVDWKAIAAAAWSRIRGGPRRGASTITMQLAGMLDSDRRGSRGVLEKWRQIRAAWAIERRWSKPEILEAYLNRATFRGEVQGVGAAATILLGKQPHGIGEAEAAVLATLLRGPNAGRRLLLRRSRTLAAGAFPDSSPALERAIELVVSTILDGAREKGPRVEAAPHAARRLLSALKPAEVRSTLEISTQRFVDETLRRHILAVRERNVRDGAVLVADNRSGEVLAYVGGSGALSSARFVDGIRARRQAGSTLKPFLYGLAFERRLLTPASLLEDSPLEVPVSGGTYRPENYDEEFRGLVSVRTALAASLNVPAVRALGLVGTDHLVRTLRQLGFEGLRESGDYYGPSLALGSADVS
ncbi:MAG: transglycosylase domain-containing protein, partial [Candidatus Binatia bacterium]